MLPMSRHWTKSRRPGRLALTLALCVLLSFVKIILDIWSLREVYSAVDPIWSGQNFTVVEVTRYIRNKNYNYVSYPPFVEFGPLDGPGEMGLAVEPNLSSLSSLERERFHNEFRRYEFSNYVSERISLHRRLHDPRPDYCRNRTYVNLRPVSVVIVFYNEAWSALLRSVHSILDRTPEKLLQEIILLDDCSVLEHLKEPLEAYIKSLLKVRLIRAKYRLGLAQARNFAFDFAQAEIVIFLDSHIECFPGWLEPLIAPILQDNQVITYPVADDIDYRTFRLKMPNYVVVGGFNIRTLTFTWSFSTKTNFTAFNSETVSPTMPGGLFAVSRDWFKRLGKFDPGLIIWGGENLEMSFKVWMCGGKVLQTTCSHVGHVFRALNPNIKSYQDIKQNAVRVAEVWMDEYKHYLYEGIKYNISGYLDVSDRVQLRESMKCNTFDWYVNNVYPDLKENLPNHDEVYFSLLKNPSLSLCVVQDKSKNNSRLGSCDDLDLKQLWYMTEKGYLVLNTYTLAPDVWTPQTNDRPRVVLQFIGRVSQREKLIWKYDRVNHRLIHSDSGQCLEADLSANTTVLATCQDGSRLQTWTLTTRRERMVIQKG